MPSKYKKGTSNSFSSYASSLNGDGALGHSGGTSHSGSEDAETVKDSKFEAERMLLMKQLADLEKKKKALESKTKADSHSSDTIVDDGKEKDVLKEVLDKKRAASSSESYSSSEAFEDEKKVDSASHASSTSQDDKKVDTNSEFELLKSMKAKLDAEVQTLKSEIFDVKNNQEDEEDNSINADGRKFLEDDTIRNAIGKCLQEAAIDGKCTDFGKESGYGEMPDWDVYFITNMEKLFYKKWHFNADLSNWDTSHVTNMKKMFYYAFGVFLKIYLVGKAKLQRTNKTTCLTVHSRFQANFVCKDKETGPVKTCISLDAKKEHTTKQPQTLVSEDEEEQAVEEAEAEMHKHDLKKITDETLHSAISKCLKEDPVTGNCDKFSASSGYGIMPHWDTSEVTDMKKAFYKRADFGGDISQWNTGSLLT